MSHAVPEGYYVKGVSTLYGPEGEVKQQWVKSHAEKEERLDELLEAIRDEFATGKRIPKIPPPKRAEEDLMVVYPMGDPHIGMYAWAEEAGEDFDLGIATRNLVAATQMLVSVAPASEQALIVNVGDYFHADNQSNRTTRSGHQLDVDTRWAKVLRAGVVAMRSCIEAALRKHQRVHVVNEIGNHDDHTAQVLTLALQMFYERNERVTFDDSPARFHYYRFGQNLIGVTHGDQTKPEALGEIMAADRPEDWGQTKHRVWLTGHVHHRRVFELRGCTVESFRTLAPLDAYAAGAGYRSGRDMHAIILHKEHGELGRHRVDAMML